jgi:hypothetical protein
LCGFIRDAPLEFTGKRMKRHNRQFAAAGIGNDKGSAVIGS